VFIAWKVLKPFRDRKSRFIILLGIFSAITCKPLKVCRQVKHCKKGFHEIFQMGLRERYVCIRNFWENLLFRCVSCRFGKVLDDFQKNFHANASAFFQGLYLASSAFKDYTKSLTIILGLGKTMLWQKSKLGQERQWEKSDFYVLRQNCCRYWISECSIGITLKYNQ